MSRRAAHVTFVVLAASLVGLPARAHDPGEITADARIAGDGLAVHVTMSLGTAAIVCPPRESLERCAAVFLRVTAAGKTLAPREARVGRGPEGDLEMHVTWTHPPRGPLAFTAPRLAVLRDPNAGVVLTVTGERAVLGQAVLSADRPRLEVRQESVHSADEHQDHRCRVFGTHLRPHREPGRGTHARGRHVGVRHRAAPRARPPA